MHHRHEWWTTTLPLLLACFTQGLALSGLVDGTNNHWGLGGSVPSPVTVDGQLDVPQSVVLTIDPGTEILLGPGVEMNVGGTLVAVGSLEHPIVFRGFAEAIPSSQYWTGLSLQNAMATVRHCHFRQVSRAVYVYAGTTLDLQNCVITEFSARALYCTGVGQEARIVNCALVPSTATVPVELHSASPVIKNCIIGSMTSDPYYCVMGLTNSQPVIAWNLLSSTQPLSGVPDGGNNVFRVDPLFVDEANGDFHLSNNSPAIDAGDPADDYSEEPSCGGANTRIDMGAYGNTPEATCKEQNDVRPAKRLGLPMQRSLAHGSEVFALDGRHLSDEGRVYPKGGLAVTAHIAEQGGSKGLVLLVGGQK